MAFSTDPFVEQRHEPDRPLLPSLRLGPCSLISQLTIGVTSTTTRKDASPIDVKRQDGGFTCLAETWI
jgi:hypothetical protein